MDDKCTNTLWLWDGEYEDTCTLPSDHDGWHQGEDAKWSNDKYQFLTSSNAEFYR